VGPTVGLDVVEKRNISCPAENRSKTGRSSSPQSSYDIDYDPLLCLLFTNTLTKCNKKLLVNNLSGLFSYECKCQGINSIVNRYENKLLLEAGT
jgi:hypothetical protein